MISLRALIIRVNCLRVLRPNRYESPSGDLEAADQLPLAQLLGHEGPVNLIV